MVFIILLNKEEIFKQTNRVFKAQYKIIKTNKYKIKNVNSVY